MQSSVSKHFDCWFIYTSAETYSSDQ